MFYGSMDSICYYMKVGEQNVVNNQTFEQVFNSIHFTFIISCHNAIDWDNKLLSRSICGIIYRNLKNL